MVFSDLGQTFVDMYPAASQPRFCRAPGRINLIGEHTDYNGLPVLPMTIDREIRMAYALRRDSVVRMRNVDVSFPEAQFENCAAIPPSPTGAWENYAKAAIEALNRHFGNRVFPGMDMLFEGNIPMSAGLSSSSALVVVTALAYLECTGKALGEDITRIELATLMADAEHYVGTRGGGMDQAIILLGDAGHACKIDFFPLRVELAPLPEGHDICACNSLVKATKTGEALHRYNEGPRTCKMLCAMIERQISKDFGMDVELNRLGDLWFGPLCLTQREIEGFVEKAFPRERTTLVEAGKALGLSEKAIRDKWLGDLREPEGGFPLRARARHQMTEYRRVESARDALQAGDAEALGALMNASHTSCANDYLVSCTELDCLVETARKCGSIGSRLTGAGFGGCTVNLVPRNRYDSFLESITTQYYEGYIPPRATVKPMPPIELARFRVTPGPGAGYVHV